MVLTFTMDYSSYGGVQQLPQDGVIIDRVLGNTHKTIQITKSFKPPPGEVFLSPLGATAATYNFFLLAVQVNLVSKEVFETNNPNASARRTFPIFDPPPNYNALMAVQLPPPPPPPPPPPALIVDLLPVPSDDDNPLPCLEHPQTPPRDEHNVDEWMIHRRFM